MRIDYRLGPLGQATLKQGAMDLPGQLIASVGFVQYAGNFARGIAADRSIHDFSQATGYTARDPQDARRAGIDQPLRDTMSNLNSSEEIGRAHRGFEDVIEGRNTPEILAAVGSDPIRAEGVRAGLDVAQMNGPGGLDIAEANGAWASVAQDRQAELREAEQGPVNPAVEQAEAREQLHAEAESTPDIWEEPSRFDDLATQADAAMPEPESDPTPPQAAVTPEISGPAPEPETDIANEPTLASGPAPESEAAPSPAAAAPEASGPTPEPAVAQPEVQPSGAQAPAPDPESAAPGAQPTVADGPAPEPGTTHAPETSTPEPEPEPQAQAPAPEPAPAPGTEPAPAPEPEPAARQPEAGL